MTFLFGQQEYIKLYMLILIEERQTYGFEMMEELKKRLREEDYKRPQSEIYRGLDELVKQKIIYGVQRTKGAPGSAEDF